MTFPNPFAGITKVVTCEDEVDLRMYVILLTTCHPHNFAVDTLNNRIHCSQNAVVCLTRGH